MFWTAPLVAGEYLEDSPSLQTVHEVALSGKVTSTKEGDGETLPELLDSARSILPEGRVGTLACDLAADSEPFHAALAEHGISPAVTTRDLWRTDRDRPLPGHEQAPVCLTYDEAGSVHCWDDSGPQPVCRRMTCLVHEANRGALKYRCPAATAEWRGGGERTCNQGRIYGLTVRVKGETDLRRFPLVPRATKWRQSHFQDVLNDLTAQTAPSPRGKVPR